MSGDIERATRIIELATHLINAADDERKRAERNNKEWLVEDCETIIKNILELKEQAAKGKLESSGGAGLGITRALCEMGASEKIYSLGLELETYYQKYY